MGEIARGNDLAKQAWGVVDCKKEVIYMLDTLIRGAKIVDGTGKAAFTADVGILDGMIEAVGNLSGAQAFETIEAASRVLTPGFIDMHRHADAALFREGFGEAELCQGLTTLVNGNCGMSLAPLSGAHADECAKYLAPITGNIPPELRFASIDSYFKAAQGRGLPLSCAELIGMGTLRTLAAGFAAGDLSPLELRDLHYHMEAALADGACGVSLGLGYAPEIFYSTARSRRCTGAACPSASICVRRATAWSMRCAKCSRSPARCKRRWRSAISRPSEGATRERPCRRCSR